MATSTSPQRTLYILYNANSTLLGKLQYGYRKLTASKDDTNPCAACDITHGGLSLKESPKWVDAKREIETKGNLKVVQLHRDEVAQHRGGSKGLDKWMKDSGVGFPGVILGQEEKQEKTFEVVVDKEGLITCGGRPDGLLKVLREKGVLREESSASL